MRGHPPALDYGRMDLAPARYMIRIKGHLGAAALPAFPALVPQHHGAETEEQRRGPCGAEAEACRAHGGAGAGERLVEAAVAVPGLQAGGYQHA